MWFPCRVWPHFTTLDISKVWETNSRLCHVNVNWIVIDSLQKMIGGRILANFLTFSKLQFGLHRRFVYINVFLKSICLRLLFTMLASFTQKLILKMLQWKHNDLFLISFILCWIRNQWDMHQITNIFEKIVIAKNILEPDRKMSALSTGKNKWLLSQTTLNHNHSKHNKTFDSFASFMQNYFKQKPNTRQDMSENFNLLQKTW